MTFFDAVKRSGRSLRHAKMRTILTILAISVGSFALMLALAAGEGAREFVNRLVDSNFNEKSLFVYKQPESGETNLFSPAEDGPQEYSEDAEEITSENGDLSATILLLDDSDLDKIRKIEGVEAVVPRVNAAVTYVTAGDQKYQTSVESRLSGVTYNTVAGNIPDELEKNQAIIPRDYVEALGLGSPESAIGQKITIQYDETARPISPRTYQIVGVAEEPSGLMGGARDIILSQAELEEIYRIQQGGDGAIKYTELLAIVNYETDEELAQIQAKFVAEGYQTLSAKELAEQITQVVNIIQYFVAGFGIIALIVSIFGIVNTQLISVLERIREIGLMKALGMSSANVMRLFLLEAMWIGFGGALLGIFVAYFVGIFLNPFIDDNLSIGGDLLMFTPGGIISLVIVLVIIAAIAGLLPAAKAAKLNPIEALRTE